MGSTQTDVDIGHEQYSKLQPMDDIATYRDGSGMASDRFRRSFRHLAEQHARLNLMESFLLTHQEKLWGLQFQCCSVWPRISLWWQAYRGTTISDPKQIARLWPDAEWSRRRSEYREHEIEWFAEVDGVTLILESAETTKPAKLPEVSGRVHLESPEPPND